MYALPTLLPSFPEAPIQDATVASTTIAMGGACGERSIWSILWSCLATTFACTWVSVHPNIPDLWGGERTEKHRRFYFTFLSLLAPEIMLLWAFKQSRGALNIMKVVNSSYRRVYETGRLKSAFSIDQK